MIILTGASASGKTEVGKCLAKKYNYKKVITYTTRNKRVGEVNDIDYHFISKEEFKRLEKTDFFFETMEYNGNFYGTARSSLCKNCYLIVDYKGLKKFLNSNIPFTSFFLDASEAVRYNRMIRRADGEDNAKRRLEVDRIAFPDEMRSLVDYVIDGDNLTVEEETDLVYLKSHKE